MKVYAMTDVGRVRPINEDSYYLPQAGEQFCAVADGMGGHNAGEVASAMAVETFAETMRASGQLSSAAIHEAVFRANEAVHAAAQRDARKSGMGTTFTAMCEEESRVHIAQVGDSRAYLIRGAVISQITQDHTLVAQMVEQGMITAREAKVHPQRNIVTRALGTRRYVDVDLFQMNKLEGDVYLLCSDGLSNHVTDRQMLEITRGEGSWEDKLQKLVQLALDAGGPDNITAMYVIPEEVHA